jgi:hypothetical protein
MNLGAKCVGQRLDSGGGKTAEPVVRNYSLLMCVEPGWKEKTND